MSRTYVVRWWQAIERRFRGSPKKHSTAVKLSLARFVPRLEVLESRDAPSSFTPSSPLVSFTPSDSSGVPFSRLVNPGIGSETPNLTGYFSSGNAISNAGVFGAPLV